MPGYKKRRVFIFNASGPNKRKVKILHGQSYKENTIKNPILFFCFLRPPAKNSPHKKQKHIKESQKEHNKKKRKPQQQIF